jgi:hypothetical protein
LRPHYCKAQFGNEALPHDDTGTFQRGSLTGPPVLRRKIGLDKLRDPLRLVEERDGGLFLQPALTLRVRDLSKAQIRVRIARDEADMKAIQSAGRGKKR